MAQEYDKVNLDIFWLKNKSTTNIDNLPIQDVSSAEITNKPETETLNLTAQLIQQLNQFTLMLSPEISVDKCINQVRQELKESLKKIIDSSDSESKGITLENFTQKLFGCFDYLKLRHRNFKNATSEIDIILTVKKVPSTLFAEFSDLLIIECKNWKKSVGAQEIRAFSSKMLEFDSKVGILISKSGISGDDDYIKNARGVIRNNWLQYRQIIIVLEFKDLESIVNGNINFYQLLEEKYFSVKLMGSN